jgi:predicted transcriptional regulator
MKHISKEKISDLLCDAHDVRNALRFEQGNLLNKPKDGDDTDTTIGDCLDNIIETLEQTHNQ